MSSLELPSYILVLGDNDEDRLEIARLYTACEKTPQKFDAHYKYGAYDITDGSNGCSEVSFKTLQNTKAEEMPKNRVHMVELPPTVIWNCEAYKIQKPPAAENPLSFLRTTINNTPDKRHDNKKKKKEVMPTETDRWFVTQPNFYTTLLHDDTKEGETNTSVKSALSHCRRLTETDCGPTNVVLRSKLVVVLDTVGDDGDNTKPMLLDEVFQLLRADREKQMMRSKQHRTDTQRWSVSNVVTEHVHDIALTSNQNPRDISTVILNVRLNHCAIQLDKTLMDIVRIMCRKSGNLFKKGGFVFADSVDEETRQVYTEWLRTPDTHFLKLDFNKDPKTNAYNLKCRADVSRMDNDALTYRRRQQPSHRESEEATPTSTSGMINLDSYDNLMSAFDIFLRCSELFSKKEKRDNDKDDGFDCALLSEIASWSKKIEKRKDSKKHSPSYNTNTGFDDYSERAAGGGAEDGEGFVSTMFKWVEMTDRIVDTILEKSWKSFTASSGYKASREEMHRTLNNNLKTATKLMNETNCGLQVVYHQDFNLKNFTTSLLNACLQTLWAGWTSVVNKRLEAADQETKKKNKILKFISTSTTTTTTTSTTADYDWPDGEDKLRCDDYTISVNIKTFVKALSEVYISTITISRLFRRALRHATCEIETNTLIEKVLSEGLRVHRDFASNMLPRTIVVTEVPTNTELESRSMRVAPLERSFHVLNFQRLFEDDNNSAQTEWQTSRYIRSGGDLLREVKSSYIINKNQSTAAATVSHATLWRLTAEEMIRTKKMVVKRRNDARAFRTTNLSKCGATHDSYCEVKDITRYTGYLEDQFTNMYVNTVNTTDSEIARVCATYHPSEYDTRKNNKKTKKFDYTICVDYTQLCDNLSPSWRAENAGPLKLDPTGDGVDFYLDFYAHLRNDAMSCAFYEGLDYMTLQEYLTLLPK